MTNDNETLILNNLRANSENTYTDVNGTEWATVYLPGACPTGMSRHVFAGYLAALKAKGLYREESDPQFASHFGLVKL